MPQPLTLQFARRIAGVRLLDPAAQTRESSASAQNPQEQPASSQDRAKEEQAAAARIEGVIQAERTRMAAELERQKGLFSQSCQTVGAIAANLDKLYQETLANNRVDIVKLAVEIARRIVKQQVTQGDYDIQAIVEEALKSAPTRQEIVIRLNPDDLPACQQHQQENPGGPFADLTFTADWSIGRGECVVETPKGVVKSFIEEHLEHISEALQKVK
ncbi:MAG: FliH/SctL family protein [Solirubrobacterales bacterium]